MEFLAGKFLIAVPELPDSNFYRSVVFMIEHNADGAMGVILNRPSDLMIKEIWKKFDAAVDVRRDDTVYFGGPVEGPVLALHDQVGFTDNQIIDGVYMTMSSMRLNELVTDTAGRFRAFSGYSGWGPGQLEMELECGGWLVCDVAPDDIFCDTSRLWRRICERIGNDIMLPTTIKKQNIGDPNLN